MEKAVDIKKEDLTGIYYLASDASGRAQRTFLKLIKINIILLIVLAILSAINISVIDSEIRFLIPLMSAIIMTISVVITFATDQGKFEKKWYDGRAIAESLKTLSWRFMMNAEPFFGLSNSDAEKRFIRDLREIKNAIRPSGELFGGTVPANEHQLTDKMREIRSKDLEARKGTYAKYRIGEQKTWYKTNSGKNSTKASKFFWIIIGLQIITVASAICMILSPEFAFNPTGLSSTIVAGLMTWMQVKQYKNLAESYGITSTELSLIEDTIPTIKSDRQFASFVSESETAVSREHTLWRARRTSE